MKKWIALFAGVIIQMILGGVYAWSVFSKGLAKDYSLAKWQSTMIFGLIIAVFTLAMIPAGKLLKKWGPRKLTALGAAFFGAGYILASFSGGNFIMLLVSLGVVSGVGIGLGYSCPLVVGMKWFPNNRGLVTGVAVGGFGAGAIVLSKLAEYMMATHSFSVLQVFQIVGITFGAIAFLCSLLLCEPKQTDQLDQKAATQFQPIKHHVVTPAFGLLCIGLFAGTFAGLLVVGNLKPLAEKIGLGELATLSITIYAIGNAFGRVVWGQLHDRLKSRKTVLLAMLSLAIPLGLLLIPMPVKATMVVIFFIGMGFGSCFVVYASSVVEFFSADLFARLYPLCFLSYGLAALIGPPIGGFIADKTGEYTMAIIISTAIVTLATSILAIKLNPKQLAVKSSQ